MDLAELVGSSAPVVARRDRQRELVASWMDCEAWSPAVICGAWSPAVICGAWSPAVICGAWSPAVICGATLPAGWIYGSSSFSRRMI